MSAHAVIPGSVCFEDAGTKVLHGQAIPLAMASCQTGYRIQSVRGKDSVKRFLGGLGFAEGASVTVVSSLGGNLIVDIKGTRIAVSKSMALRVFVC